MNSITNYRDQCLQLAKLLEQKNKEIKELQTQQQSQFTFDNPALETLRIFAETLVTVQRNGEVCFKTSGYVDVPKKSFLEASKTALNNDNIASYKQTLIMLHLVAPASFGQGGISARINGNVTRVVRIPSDIYSLFASLDGVTL